MKRCAFLTLDEPGDFVIDDDRAIGPLAELGWQVEMVSWRQRDQPWTDFDAVIIRSTWDYWNDVPEFMGILTGIDRDTWLANPLELVYWNLDKRYLRDLEHQGIAIVPTLWSAGLPAEFLERCFEQLDSRELVVKPIIGANGEDAFRVSRLDGAERRRELAACFRERGCMVQPFMPAIVSEGEYSLFFFAGAFSHAIRKVPAPAEFRCQEERGAQLHAAVPEPRLLQAAGDALDALLAPALYARIDLIRDDSGDFAVMELELIEPSMYLRMDDGAPGRFAHAIDRWFPGPGTP